MGKSKSVRPEPFGCAQESPVEACHELVEWDERIYAELNDFLRDISILSSSLYLLN
ncbi:MAG: hypothetical protein ACXWTS_09050 [Methylococcaceae bacterium]